MARNRPARVISISVGEPDPDTRKVGPLIGDSRWDSSDPLKGGAIFSSGVMQGRGVSHEPMKIKTISSRDASREADLRMEKRNNHGEG